MQKENTFLMHVQITNSRTIIIPTDANSNGVTYQFNKEIISCVNIMISIVHVKIWIISWLLFILTIAGNFIVQVCVCILMVLKHLKIYCLRICKIHNKKKVSGLGGLNHESCFSSIFGHSASMYIVE